MRTHGVPAKILTDSGKVFTNRFGKCTGEVLFDRICRENGIKYRLTKPRSPTETGKIERWHKTLRAEFLTGKTFESIADAQAQLDAWVTHYNEFRPHRAIGNVAPIERFRLAVDRPEPVDGEIVEASPGAITSRRVWANGLIGFATARYMAGTWLAGQAIEVTCDGGLVHLHHRGELIATHARWHPIDRQAAGVKPVASIDRPSSQHPRRR